MQLLIGDGIQPRAQQHLGAQEEERERVLPVWPEAVTLLHLYRVQRVSALLLPERHLRGADRQQRLQLLHLILQGALQGILQRCHIRLSGQNHAAALTRQPESLVETVDLASHMDIPCVRSLELRLRLGFQLRNVWAFSRNLRCLADSAAPAPATGSSASSSLSSSADLRPGAGTPSTSVTQPISNRT